MKQERKSISLVTAAAVSLALNIALARATTLTDTSWRSDLGVDSQTWSLAMRASGRLALLDLHDLYVKEPSKLQSVRLPPFRGGGAGEDGDGSERNKDDDVLYNPRLSLSTAWSASSAQLPAPSQSATKAAIRECAESSQSVSPANDLQTTPGGASAGSCGQDMQQVCAGSRRTNTVSTTTRASGQARALVVVWASWNILNGALLTLTPKDSYDFAAYLVEAIGAVRVSHGLQLFLAAGANISAQKVMGVGILVRLVFLAASFALGTYETLQTQSKAPFLLSAGVMSMAAFSLLSNKGRPMLMANLFSTTTCIKGMNMIFRPFASNRLFGMGFTDGTKIPGKYRSLGFHLVISSVFMNALSHGMEPIRAAGLSAATWLALLAELTFVSGGYRRLSDVPRVYLFFLASALVCSIVFLTDTPRKHVDSSSVGDALSVSGWRSDEEGASQEILWKQEDVYPLMYERDDNNTSDACTKH